VVSSLTKVGDMKGVEALAFAERPEHFLARRFRLFEDLLHQRPRDLGPRPGLALMANTEPRVLDCIVDDVRAPLGQISLAVPSMFSAWNTVQGRRASWYQFYLYSE